ncbi:MAG: DUF1349 domain-containing protein [Pirellulales bacterium]|nr:DUF1349 domain-containing protein [Pirellulales bacterium]
MNAASKTQRGDVRVLLFVFLIALFVGGISAYYLWSGPQENLDAASGERQDVGKQESGDKDTGSEKAIAESDKPIGPSFAGHWKDEFSGATCLPWTVVRPLQGSVSLTEYPGQLSIQTEVGSIWGKKRDDELAKLAPNLHVLANPAKSHDSWQLTTELVEFSPKGQFHQAGLLIYQDDDNYIKFVIQYNTRVKANLGFSYERDGQAKANRSIFDLKQPHVWLRVQRHAEVYQAFVSYDGEQFTPVGEISWSGQPSHVGLIAKQGDNFLLEKIAARFNFFAFDVLDDATAEPSGGQ